MNPRIDRAVHTTRSTGRAAGLVTGMSAIDSRIPVLAIGVRAPRAQQQAVAKLDEATAALIGFQAWQKGKDVVASCGHVGPGYGLPRPDMAKAVKMLAERGGSSLDPVYSGKGMAGSTDLIRRLELERDQDVVFVHTGGSAALFGYPGIFGLSGPQET